MLHRLTGLGCLYSGPLSFALAVRLCPAAMPWIHQSLRLCGCAQLSDDDALQATHGCNALRLLELPSGRMAVT